MQSNDKIKHPSHYCSGGIETIDFIKAKLGTEMFYGYCMGNVMKYVSRAGKKDDAIEDLKKAQVYLGWAIDTAESITIDKEIDPAYLFDAALKSAANYKEGDLK